MEDTIPVGEVTSCLGEGDTSLTRVGELENCGLPLQVPPHENISEEPSLFDARLAKNQDDLLSHGYRPKDSKMLEPLFRSEGAGGLLPHSCIITVRCAGLHSPGLSLDVEA
jgi:hypothetical protein